MLSNAYLSSLSRSFSPRSLFASGQTGMWLEPYDLSTGWQDTGATTSASVGDPVGRRNDKSGRTYNVLQSTASSRPVLNLTSGVYSDAFDGVDDVYSAASVVLGADMDCFIALKRGGTSSTQCVGVRGATGQVFCYWQANGGGLSSNGVGSAITQYVNGAAIPGGTFTTPIQTAAAIPIGAWCIYEARNLDLSGWASLSISGYPSFFLNGSIGGVILCPAQSSDTRTKIRHYLGAKVGVAL